MVGRETVIFRRCIGVVIKATIIGKVTISLVESPEVVSANSCIHSQPSAAPDGPDSTHQSDQRTTGKHERPV
jgi:hypothetical protein